MNFDLSNTVTEEMWCKKIDMYQIVVRISKGWNSVKPTTSSNCFTKCLENADVEEFDT